MSRSPKPRRPSLSMLAWGLVWAGMSGCSLTILSDTLVYDSGVVIADGIDFLTPGRRDAGPGPGQDAEPGRELAPGEDAMMTAPDALPGLDRPAIPDATPIAEAARAQLRFKGGVVVQAELARALELRTTEVATELGANDAFDVHRIALRGSEPYVSGIVEPIENTSVTSPIVIDRVTLSACRTRVDRDFAAPARGVIFQNLPLNASGALTDRGAAPVGEAVDRLYRRLLGRDPEAFEREIAIGMYTTVEAGSEPRPARAWAILACFLVASGDEMLFY